MLLSVISILALSRSPLAQPTDHLEACGDAFYSSSKYTCYDGDFLCPVLGGEATLRCGRDCYLPEMYSCSNGHLLQVSASAGSSNSSSSACKVTTQHLSDPPYQNYFYSDCHAASQVVVTSPLPGSNLTIIGPRLIVAWPAGNSGICTFFQPQNGVNGSLGLELVNSSIGTPLSAVYDDSVPGSPIVGVTGVLSFNSSAELTVPILGSIRNIRDFTEGPSILQPLIQGATNASEHPANGGATLSRLWLDNITTTTFTMTPYGGTGSSIKVKNKTLSFEAGKYTFSASFNYPQLKQLTAEVVLNSESQGLIAQMPDQTTSLAFLSYTEKLLAGAWRFLTYFGRDSMISALLLEPVFSQGNGSAMEAVLGAVLERINRTDGSVCHEETIGDYATFLNHQNNITSTAASCTYLMIDTDYYLPVLMDRYFTQSSVGPSRLQPFLAREAGRIEIDVLNKGLNYGDLALQNAERIMKLAAPFAQPGGQTTANLIHLKPDYIVGEWRDSTYGIGGGRIPFDVNTGLVPAALRSIAALSRFNSSIYPGHKDWGTLADKYAQVWEDHTLSFFEQSISPSEATSRLNTFVKSATFYDGPTHASTISQTSNTTFYSVALDGYNNLASVDVLHSDTCFRLFLLNSTNQAQLTSFLGNVASSIIRPFPAGLSTPVGLVVANPALGAEAVLTRNFTNSAYHGTVVWSWPLAMMAKGLELQLARCTASGDAPDFCKDTTGVHKDVRDAYNTLWDTIEANENQLSSEVWSWVYKGGKFVTTPLGSLPPPPGLSGATESDVRQLWSLTFLAVKRDKALNNNEYRSRVFRARWQDIQTFSKRSRERQTDRKHVDLRPRDEAFVDQAPDSTHASKYDRGRFGLHRPSREVLSPEPSLCPSIDLGRSRASAAALCKSHENLHAACKGPELPQGRCPPQRISESIFGENRSGENKIPVAKSQTAEALSLRSRISISTFQGVPRARAGSMAGHVNVHDDLHAHRVTRGTIRICEASLSPALAATFGCGRQRSRFARPIISLCKESLASPMLSFHTPDIGPVSILVLSQLIPPSPRPSLSAMTSTVTPTAPPPPPPLPPGCIETQPPRPAKRSGLPTSKPFHGPRFASLRLTSPPKASIPHPTTPAKRPRSFDSPPHARSTLWRPDEQTPPAELTSPQQRRLQVVRSALLSRTRGQKTPKAAASALRGTVNLPPVPHYQGQKSASYPWP